MLYSTEYVNKEPERMKSRTLKAKNHDSIIANKLSPHNDVLYIFVFFIYYFIILIPLKITARFLFTLLFTLNL